MAESSVAPPVVTVLANPSCAHCMHACDCMTEWALAAGVPIAAIDVCKHPEVAMERGIEMSPAVVIEGRPGHEFIGVPTHTEFLRLIRG